MRDYFRVDRPVPQRYRVGPLSPYIDRLAAALAARQEARMTRRHKLRVIARLSHWLERKRLTAADVDDRRVARFFRDEIGYDATQHGNWVAVRLLQWLLRDEGVLPAPTPLAQADGRHATEVDFEQYLKRERGLSQASLTNVLPFVRSFLAYRFGGGIVAVGEIQPADVTGFMVRLARTLHPARTKILAWALRSYLRFLYWRGESTTDLSAVVPAVASWRFSTVPKSIEPEEVERLLKSCNRETTTGRRDLAILLLLARLGLRSNEVIGLTLDDIDWRSGQLTVHGKGSRCDRLPLPHDVGEALAGYLVGRPRCSTRRMFLRTRAPVQELSNQTAIACIVRRRLARAGIVSSRKGAYLLRHSLAVRMLRRGASLAEIGEILRHRHPDTTTIYAKVDFDALKALAQPWPGGAS